MAYKSVVVTDPSAIGTDARNRILYQSEALAVRRGAASPDFLTRVQSVNYSFSVGRTDVNQFGELAAIDRVILEQPTVSMDFSYILHGRSNEAALGFNTTSSTTSMIADIIAGTGDKSDYFISLADEGVDAAGPLGGTTIESNIKIPSGFITSYSASGSVGEFPTATVNIEALDMKIGKSHDEQTNVNAKNASTEENTASYVLRPGEIDLDIRAFGGVVHLQSFTLTVDLTREAINRLGTNFPFARVISFPLNATLSAEGILSKDDESATNNSLAHLVDDDTSMGDLAVDCKSQGTGHIGGIKYIMKKAKLDSYSYTSSIGANKAVSMDWSVPIGSESQTDRGVFIVQGGTAE